MRPRKRRREGEGRGAGAPPPAPRVRGGAAAADAFAVEEDEVAPLFDEGLLPADEYGVDVSALEFLGDGMDGEGAAAPWPGDDGAGVAHGVDALAPPDALPASTAPAWPGAAPEGVVATEAVVVVSAAVPAAAAPAPLREGGTPYVDHPRVGRVDTVRGELVPCEPSRMPRCPREPQCYHVLLPAYVRVRSMVHACGTRNAGGADMSAQNLYLQASEARVLSMDLDPPGLGVCVACATTLLCMTRGRVRRIERLWREHLAAPVYMRAKGQLSPFERCYVNVSHRRLQQLGDDELVPVRRASYRHGNHATRNRATGTAAARAAFFAWLESRSDPPAPLVPGLAGSAMVRRMRAPLTGVGPVAAAFAAELAATPMPGHKPVTEKRVRLWMDAPEGTAFVFHRPT